MCIKYFGKIFYQIKVFPDAAAAYKTKHFENRSHFKEFTATVVNFQVEPKL